MEGKIATPHCGLSCFGKEAEYCQFFFLEIRSNPEISLIDGVGCWHLWKAGSGELWMQKSKSHLMRTQSLNVLPLKPGVGQYTAIHATLTARDFFLAYFYTSGPLNCIFSKTSPNFSLCWLWLTHASCVGPQNKIGHPAGCRFPC